MTPNEIITKAQDVLRERGLDINDGRPLFRPVLDWIAERVRR